MFSLEYPGWPYRAIIKTAKNGKFCEELYSEILATYQAINQSTNSEKWLVTRIQPTKLKKLLKLKRKRSNNWPMVSFIHHGKEITTWIGHSFKTNGTKSKATF